MTYAEVVRLVELGGACGVEVRRGRLCLRKPGHVGDCSDRFDPGPISESERLRRRLAKKSVTAERRDHHVVHLTRIVHDRDKRIEWMSGFIGFRIEYRLRGGARRLRRWRRQAVWALGHRTLSGWRW